MATNSMETPSTLSLSEQAASNHWGSSPQLFQFPTAEADDRISNWLHGSCQAVMSAPSETHSDDLNALSDSTYEFIDTDEESRDGNATESIASTDFGRPDDISSLADTERSDEEESDSERSRATSGIPAFTGLDGPNQTPTIGRSTAVFSDDVDRTLVHSIEFEEPISLGDENVSVKHTVADFNEEETEKIAKRLMLRSPPKRLVATIRQTMTRQGLSTRDPLRILYVGCHTAKQDIIRKIASSVAASVGNDRHSGSLSHRSSQLFHVVPITAFGSEKPPEIELMQSSGYQIKVEDCSAARNIKYEDESDRPDVLKLILEDNYSYHSVPDGSGFIVEPPWELPHVAVFYCSENDTLDMRRVRIIAKTFMSRHKVPSIVISHNQPWEESLGIMTLDQHAIHMCLESRDPNGPRNIIHQRLPIDLDSFKTIDARQMNRNLAYLTGLHEPLNKGAQPASAGKVVSRALASDIEKTSYSLSDSVSFIRTRTGAEWRALVPVGMLLLSVFAAVLTGTLQYRTPPTHAVSINGNLTSTEPMSVSTTATTPASAVTASLMTSTETRTATRTITVLKSESPISNGLALKPSMELGKLSETSQALTAMTEEKSTVCNAEVLGDREILIRIPTATKLSWLSKEAMSVNVTRESETVEPERVYSTIDGIVLQLSEKEAYGVLNISIITRKKPKVNETFKVEFGTSWRHDFNELSWARLRERLRTVDGKINDTMAQVRTFAERALAQSQLLFDVTRQRLDEANKLAAQRTTESSKTVTKIAKAVSMDLAKWSAILSKEVGMQVAEAKIRLSKVCDELQSLPNQRVRKPLEEALLVAQVRSRLYWLKIQGKQEEHHEYKKRATMAFRRREEEGAKARRMAEDRIKKVERASLKHDKRSCRKGAKKGCGA